MKFNEYAALDLYLGNFAARHDAYVQDSRWHREEPLTPEVARAAFKQGHSISGYMAVPRTVEGTKRMMTHIGAIDFDLDDGMAVARKVRAGLAEHDIPSLLEGSRRGAHLWVITTGDGTHSSEPFGMVPASVMRRALTAAVVLEHGQDDKVEVFPKKSSKDWGVGALRMPLQKHPKTGVRYPAHDPFDDAEVTSIVSLLNLMADIQTETTYNALYRLAGAAPVPRSYPTGTGYEKPLYAATGDVPQVTALLATLGVRATPGHSARCPFHEDKKASLSVSTDDERCWCKSPACPMYNDGRGMGSIALDDYIRKESPLATRSP